MTTITFYDDIEKIQGQGYLDRGQQMTDETSVYKTLNDTVITREQLTDPKTIATIADAYYVAVGGMARILNYSYRSNINMNSVGDQITQATVRRHEIAMMRLFSEMNATRLKLRPLILQCAEDPKVKDYLDRLNKGTFKSRRILLLSQCLDHINNVTWQYNLSIPDVMDDDEIVYLYDKLLGENYGKTVPENVGRIMYAWDTVIEDGDTPP
ncbi:MAG: hypothetical protein ACOVRN_12410 [Flavobacterium sp.]